MASCWNITYCNTQKVVKKKYTVDREDINDWVSFTKKLDNINDKESDFDKKHFGVKNFSKLDLHGFSLAEANKEVAQFITESFNDGRKKLLIITGKGLRSKSFKNPYLSEKLNILRHSVPEFIINNKNLNKKINKISEASLKDGGEGAIYIFLKNNKKFKE